MKQGWEIKKLGEVATFQRGLTYSKEDEVEFSCNGVLRSNNIDLNTTSLVFDELKYVREDLVIAPDKKLSKGGILICMSNGSKQHLGKVAFIDKDYDYAFGGFMGLIKPNDDICAKYVYYTCISSSYKHFLAGVGCGANITNLKFVDLAQHTIPVPAREEQERIVGELDCLSGIIDNKRAQLRELDALAQSIFYTMFGDPITNDKGWETKKLGEVATYINGYAFKPEHWTDAGMPIIRIQNLNNQEAVFNYSNMEIPKKYIVEYGDILISWSASLGVYEWYGERSYLNQHIFKVVFDKCNINKCFFRYIVNSNINEMLKNAHGATMKHIVKKDFDNTIIKTPPIELQKQFAEKIENIERQKELIKQSVKETEDLFNSRMNYYFN